MDVGQCECRGLERRIWHTRAYGRGRERERENKMNINLIQKRNKKKDPLVENGRDFRIKIMCDNRKTARAHSNA